MQSRCYWQLALFLAENWFGSDRCDWHRQRHKSTTFPAAHISPFSGVLSILLLALSSCTPQAPTGRNTATSSPTDPWAHLRRAITLPKLPSGSACPRSTGKEIDTKVFGGFYLGPGPYYANIVATRDAQGIYHWEDARPDDEWQFLKTHWTAPPTYFGAALIRGRRLDGTGDVRFNGDDQPGAINTSSGLTLVLELRFRGRSPSDSDWMDAPTVTRVKAAGGYGLQVDTAERTYSIVFEVAR